MTDDTTLPFAFPAVGRKKVTVAFDGGRITWTRSDATGRSRTTAWRRREARRGDPDDRDASRIVHALADILRAHILAIACGCEGADDLDSLRFDPAFKLACGAAGQRTGISASGPTETLGTRHEP